MKIRLILFFLFVFSRQVLPNQPQILSITSGADSVLIRWEICTQKPVSQAIFVDTLAIVDTTVAPSSLLPTQVLFMVDTSIPMRPMIKQIQKYLEMLFTQKPDGYQFALVSFDDGVRIHAKFDTDAGTLSQKVNEIRAKGGRTELYRSIIEGIDLFSTSTPVQKIMVIFSDGDAEDTPAYPLSLVLEKAREKNIFIYSAAYLQKANSTLDQNLRRLSEATDGYFERADAKHQLSAAFQEKIFEPKKYRGEILVRNSDLPLRLRFQRQVAVILKLKFADGTAVDTPLQVDKKPLIAYGILYSVGGVLLFLLLLFIGIWLWKKFLKKPDPVSKSWGMGGKELPTQPKCPACGALIRESDAKCQACGTPVFMPDASALAWFESPKGQKLAVKVASCKIGALESNHIVLNDPTISRTHAILDLKDRKFILTDRNSTNHTLVNDKKISSIQLNDGDLVQFGNMQFLFSINPLY